MTLMHIRVPDELHAALKREAAERTDGNVTVLVCQILSSHLNMPYTPSKRGGDRLASRLVGVYIRVNEGRAVVVKAESGVITPAKNAIELERLALLAVERRGGNLSKPKFYPCPPTLAEQAVW